MALFKSVFAGFTGKNDQPVFSQAPKKSFKSSPPLSPFFSSATGSSPKRVPLVKRRTMGASRY